MWSIYLAVILAVALFSIFFLFGRRSTVRSIGDDELLMLQKLPVFPLGWTEEQWSAWRPLMDKELVQLTDVEGDFGPSAVLVPTDAGERFLTFKPT